MTQPGSPGIPTSPEGSEVPKVSQFEAVTEAANAVKAEIIAAIPQILVETATTSFFDGSGEVIDNDYDSMVGNGRKRDTLTSSLVEFGHREEVKNFFMDKYKAYAEKQEAHRLLGLLPLTIDALAQESDEETDAAIWDIIETALEIPEDNSQQKFGSNKPVTETNLRTTTRLLLTIVGKEDPQRILNALKNVVSITQENPQISPHTIQHNSQNVMGALIVEAPESLEQIEEFMSWYLDSTPDYDRFKNFASLSRAFPPDSLVLHRILNHVAKNADPKLLSELVFRGDVNDVDRHVDIVELARQATADVQIESTNGILTLYVEEEDFLHPEDPIHNEDKVGDLINGLRALAENILNIQTSSEELIARVVDLIKEKKVFYVGEFGYSQEHSESAMFSTARDRSFSRLELLHLLIIRDQVAPLIEDINSENGLGIDTSIQNWKQDIIDRTASKQKAMTTIAKPSDQAAPEIQEAYLNSTENIKNLMVQNLMSLLGSEITQMSKIADEHTVDRLLENANKTIVPRLNEMSFSELQFANLILAGGDALTSGSLVKAMTGEQFTPMNVNKTGSGLTIFTGEKLKGLVINEINQDSAEIWRELAENSPAYTGGPYDGIYVAPYYKGYPLRDGSGDVRVYSRYSGINVAHSLALFEETVMPDELKLEIERQRQHTLEYLEKKGVDHRHTHLGNFTLEFIRPEYLAGKNPNVRDFGYDEEAISFEIDDYLKEPSAWVPVLRLIDWDRAIKTGVTSPQTSSHPLQ